MDKKPSKKLQMLSKRTPVELTYRQVELDTTTIPALDRAFDILFEEVLRRKSEHQTCAKVVIGSYVQLGVHSDYGVFHKK